MTDKQIHLSSTEALFVFHPNRCTSLELLQLAISSLVVNRVIRLNCEHKTIHRKRAGSIRRHFFYLSLAETENDTEFSSFENLIVSQLGERQILLQHFIKELDKKLNGIEVFKSYVFDSLRAKSLVWSSFSFFGLITPRYSLRKYGKSLLEELKRRFDNRRFEDPTFHLVSVDPEVRVLEMSEMKELPEDLRDLRLMSSSDWKSAATASGLDPRGFLPI